MTLDDMAPFPAQNVVLLHTMPHYTDFVTWQYISSLSITGHEHSQRKFEDNVIGFSASTPSDSLFYFGNASALYGLLLQLDYKSTMPLLF